MHGTLREGESRIQQKLVDDNVAGLVPELSIAFFAADVMGTSQMHDFVCLCSYERGLGQYGCVGRIEAERTPVSPEIAACGIRFQRQAQGDGTKKRMVQHERRTGADHGEMGLPFECCHNVTSIHGRWLEPSRQRRMCGQCARRGILRHA